MRSSDIDPRLRIDRTVRDGRGRRTDSESSSGRYVGNKIPDGKAESIALDATVRAAALHGGESGRFTITESDVREKVYERKTGTTIIFVVDASGSMGARRRMSAVKGAVLSLLTDAYQKRDRVGLVSFRGDRGEVLLAPTNSVESAKSKMESMPTGGKTPLIGGLETAYRLFSKEASQHPKDRLHMIVISDGRGNVGSRDEMIRVTELIKGLHISSLVLDTESGAVSLGMARRLSDDLDGRYMKLDEIGSTAIASAVRSATGDLR